MEITPRPVRLTSFRHDASTVAEEPIPSARVLVQIPDLNCEAEATAQYRPVLRKVYINPKAAMAGIGVALLVSALLWMRDGDASETASETAPDWQVTSPGPSQWAGGPTDMTPADATGSIATTVEPAPATGWNAVAPGQASSAPPLVASNPTVQPDMHPAPTQPDSQPLQQFPHNADQHGPSFTYPPVPAQGTAFQESAPPLYQQPAPPFGHSGAAGGTLPNFQPDLSSSTPYPNTQYGNPSVAANPHATAGMNITPGQQYVPQQQAMEQQQFNGWANEQPAGPPPQPTWMQQPSGQQAPFGQPNTRVASRPEIQSPLNTYRPGQPGVAQPTGQIFHPSAESRHEQHGSGLY